MLDELGLAGEQDPGVRLVESIDDVVSTVADDLYLSRYAREIPPFGPADARRLAAAAVGDGAAILVPEVESEDDPAGERVAFAAAARAETARRKQLSGLRDFDDLLVLLHDVLADDEHGPRACQRIRDRFRVALVDEFQDTDPLQWDILRRAFHGHTTLVLVGDPKQAIYAFRGAEVLSYLDAVAHADSRRELTTNRRSDAGLLAALEHIHGGAALGHKEITVHTVAATRPFSRLTGAPEMVIPFRLRCLPRTGAGPLNRSGYPTVGRQRERVATDVAADIVRLLESGTTIDAGGERPLYSVISRCWCAIAISSTWCVRARARRGGLGARRWRQRLRYALGDPMAVGTARFGAAASRRPGAPGRRDGTAGSGGRGDRFRRCGSGGTAQCRTA